MIRASEIIPKMLSDRLRYECQQRGLPIPGVLVTVRRDPSSGITMVRYEIPGRTALNVPLIGDLNELAFVEVVPKITKSAADYFAKSSPVPSFDRVGSLPLPEGVWRPPL